MLAHEEAVEKVLTESAKITYQEGSDESESLPFDRFATGQAKHPDDALNVRVSTGLSPQLPEPLRLCWQAIKSFDKILRMQTNTHSDEQRCAAYLKALADPLRLQIMRALQTGALSVSDLSILLEQEIGTVSHHLRVLFHAGLVHSQREGKFIYYSWSDLLRQGRTRSRRGSLNLGCCKLDLTPMSEA